MTNPKPIVRNADLDYADLDRELDKVKTSTFLGKNACFIGSIMCTMPFTWTSDIKTACTNGISLWWNPYWFLQLPKETRKTVLMHELWHVGEMDMLRRGNRDPKLWNYACDVRINNRLQKQGYSFAGTTPWKDPVTFRNGDIVNYGDKPPEEIYDDLKRRADEEWLDALKQWGLDDEGDLIELDGADSAIAEMDVLSKVVQASQIAQMAGEKLSGEIEEVLKQFLTPKIPWEQHVYRWFDAHIDFDYSMSKRNRRYQHVYLPSLVCSEGLENLFYFFDVSASVTEGMKVRFNSEVKYIWETFKPEKLTLILFDTKITKVIELVEGDSFDHLTILGGGGTSLVCVREYIEEHKPTAAIIFTDLDCTPMQKTDVCPILWVVVNNPNKTVNCGDMIHIRE